MKYYIVEASVRDSSGATHTHYFKVEAETEEEALAIFNEWNRVYNGVLNDPMHIYGDFNISSKTLNDIKDDIKNGRLRPPGPNHMKTPLIEDVGGI